MSKTIMRATSSINQFRSSRSDETDLATFRAFVAELKNDPLKLQAIAVKAGIVTRAGKLTKAYKE